MPAKTKMNNQTAATLAAIANAVDWEKTGFDQQAIIEAANQGKLGGPLTSWLVTQEWNQIGAYRHPLFKFNIGATDGKDTHATARKVFPAGFDSDFENWGIVFSGVAPEMEVASYELIRNGKFSDFLGNTVAELEKCRMLGSQFLKICRDTPDKFKNSNRANFFVLTKGDESVAKNLSNVFVPRVHVFDDSKLSAYLFRFQDSHGWNGDFEHRVFSPQQ